MNEREIQSLKHNPTGKNQYSLGTSLYLRVYKKTKTFVLRKKVEGKEIVVTLGHYPDMRLRDAKIQAVKYLKKSVTADRMSDIIDRYKDVVVYPRSKVPKQVEGYLNHIGQAFGSRKVMDVTTKELVVFIEKYSEERGARSADRLKSYLKLLFGFAVERGIIQRSPMVEVTKRVTGYEKVDRDRVLSDDEIRMIWAWRNAERGWQKTEDNARVAKFLLLTGLRISEAQKGSIDGDFFRIEDTKGRHSKKEKRPHWVYLTKTSRELLPLPKSTATNIQAWLKRRLIAEGYKDEDRFTPHDLRRTFATRANTIGVEFYIVERCLNHKLPGVMAVYNQADYMAERIETYKRVEKRIQEVLGE